MDAGRFFSVFKTAGKGLAAQRRQISVASENIANAHTTSRLNGVGPYKPKTVINSMGGSGRFERALKDSLLQMRTSQSTHLPEPQSEQKRLAGGENLGPITEVQEQEKFRFEYDPEHPDADENGMVRYPDVDMVEEMTRMVSANRLYEANLSVIEAEKQILKRSFEI